MKSKINWKMFWILLVMSLLSVLCVFPYVLTLQADLFKQIAQPIELILALQIVQSFILFSLTIFAGLYFTQRIGFKITLIEAILEKGDSRKVIKNILFPSFLIGIGVAVVIYVLDFVFTMQGSAITTHQNYAPIWQKLLASFYGGVSEEILLRLFLMTFFIWLGMKLFKQKQPNKVVIIISIILAAIIFGLGHLPITASITKIDALVVARAIILNGIGGVVFGCLFWKKGLESAMIAHFTTDIFLLSLLPLVLTLYK